MIVRNGDRIRSVGRLIAAVILTIINAVTRAVSMGREC